ncbi:MAG: hypothetical protein M3349_00545 [Actinomycetota bacterium]|nr:hypothetical protein [Actinomycetota bacterium]
MVQVGKQCRRVEGVRVLGTQPGLAFGGHRAQHQHGLGAVTVPVVGHKGVGAGDRGVRGGGILDDAQLGDGAVPPPDLLVGQRELVPDVQGDGVLLTEDLLPVGQQLLQPGHRRLGRGRLLPGAGQLGHGGQRVRMLLTQLLLLPGQHRLQSLRPAQRPS